MTATCTIHNTQMYQSKFDPEKFYHFIGGDKANGTCHGEGLGRAIKNGRAEDTPNDTRQFQRKHDTMLMCNAMNNATALVSSGQIAPENLEEWFKRILDALETYT